MRSTQTALITVLLVVIFPATFFAQASQPAESISLPRLINISGIFTPADGQPPAAEVVTLAIYGEETGGEPLWHETQSINVDPSGRYTVLLGATQADGVPLDIFASGEARWLGVAWAGPGEVEGPRMRLTAVPYALRAADADTLGGRPASAYVLSPTAGDTAAANATTSSTSNTDITPAGVNPGTQNFLAKYVNGIDVGNSAVYEIGGKVGVNTTVPRDFIHSTFTNLDGMFTGVAVQNLGNTATSFSGMLFFDQGGNLGQFQGFNNVTHEYRINNIARSGFPTGPYNGTINFMIGFNSRFLVNTDGRINFGTLSTLSPTTTGSMGQALGWKPPGSTDNGGVFLEGSGDGESGGFYADGNTAAIWSAGDADLLRVYDEDTLTIPHNPAVTIPRFAVDGAGNIRVGSGTTGCVMDVDFTLIAGTCSSDERLKKDIRAFDGNMLARALKLRPVYYHWRPELLPSQPPVATEAYGLIAQEVEVIYPEMVTTDGRGYKAVDYSKLQFVLLEALKEEHAKTQALENKVTTLEKRLAKLEAALDGAAQTKVPTP